MFCSPEQKNVPLLDKGVGIMSARVMGWMACLLIALAVLGGMSAAALEEGEQAALSLRLEEKTLCLSWTPVEGATRYGIYRAAKPTGNFKRIAYTKNCTFVQKFQDKGVFYQVCPMTGSKRGQPSNVVGAIPGVKGLAVHQTQEGFRLQWQKADFATAYQVQASDSASGPWQALGLPTRQTHMDIPDHGGSTRYFRVVSLYGPYGSGVSGAVSVYAPVSNVQVICEEEYLTGPTDRLNVTWAASVGATGYRVYRAILPQGQYELLGQTTQTYYPDQRLPTAVQAYKVQPLYGQRAGALSEAATLFSGMPANVLPPDDVQSPSGILLLVNKRAQVVTAYVRDASGAYTLPLRHMICSTGRVYQRTPEGTFSLINKKNEWHRYPTGVYVRYPSVYRSGYYFHSPLYHAGKTVVRHSVAQLGTRQSLGCIRLKVSDAKWIYDHCPVGTTVYICDGAKLSSLRKALKPRKVSVQGF